MRNEGHLANLTQEDSSWRQSRVVRYGGLGIRNFTTYEEWSDTKGRGFWLNQLTRILAKPGISRQKTEPRVRSLTPIESSKVITKRSGFCLTLLALLRACSDGIQLPCFEMPYGAVHMARNWWKTPAERKRRTEALHPVGFQELKFAWVWSLLSLQMRPQPQLTQQWQPCESPLKPYLPYRKCNINISDFKLLGLGGNSQHSKNEYRASMVPDGEGVAEGSHGH